METDQSAARGFMEADGEAGDKLASPLIISFQKTKALNSGFGQSPMAS